MKDGKITTSLAGLLGLIMSSSWDSSINEWVDTTHEDSVDVEESLLREEQEEYERERDYIRYSRD